MKTVYRNSMAWHNLVVFFLMTTEKVFLKYNQVLNIYSLAQKSKTLHKLLISKYLFHPI